MKKLILTLALFAASAGLLRAGEIVTYQGRLKQGGVPVNANRQFSFELCSDPSAAFCVPSPDAGQPFQVANGLFKSTFTLPAVGLSAGPWYLRVSVDGSPLSPLERLTSVPYAVQAASASYASALAVSAGPGVLVSTHVLISGAMTVGDWSAYPSSETVLTAHALTHDVTPGVQDVRVGLMGMARSGSGDSADIAAGGDFESEVPSGMGGGMVGLRTANRNYGLASRSIGLAVDALQNGGTIGETYGVWIATMTAGAQAVRPYALYSMDPNARSYFAGPVGISSAAPAYSLAVSSASGAIFWVAEDGAHSVKFVGDGSGLSGVTGASGTDSTKVLKTGDVMSGTLTLNADTSTAWADLVTRGIAISTAGVITSTGAGTGPVAGDPRGYGAVDLQNSRTASAQIASGFYSFLGGGRNNTSASFFSVVVGGQSNTANGDRSAALGGESNQAGAYAAVVAGGSDNRALGTNAAVGGGQSNWATGQYSVIPGGSTNSVPGKYSITAGGSGNSAVGDYTFAAGFGSSSTVTGAFTWADSAGLATKNTVQDRVLFKARGGFLVTGSTNAVPSGTLDRGVFISGNGLVGIATGSPQAALDVVSDVSAASLPSQLWRTPAGVIVASMSAAGHMMAVRYVGDGSGLTGVTGATGTDSTKVLKTGDTMSGALDMGGNNILNVSTISVATGFIVISPSSYGNGAYSVSIGSEARNNYSYGVGIGYMAYDNYNTGVGIGNVSYGNYGAGVGIGNATYDNYTDGVGIGNQAHTNHDSGVGIGDSTLNNYFRGVGVGAVAGNNNTYGVGIGYGAANNGNYGVGVGAFSQNNGNFGSALGAYTTAGSSSAAVGYGAGAHNVEAVALGAGARANAQRSVAIGAYAVNNATGTVKIKENYVLAVDSVNVSGGGAALSLSTNVAVTGYVSAARYYGDASYLSNVPADNLGSHTASRDINLSSFSLVNVSSLSMSGLFISSTGVISTTGTGTGFVAGNNRGVGAVDLQTNRGAAVQVASGYYAVISGGIYNQASSVYATVPGGSNNTASGQYSYAAGYAAVSSGDNSFTWSDSGGNPVTNGVADRALFKAKGGFLVTGSTNPVIGGLVNRGVVLVNGTVGVSTGAPQAALDVVSTATAAGVYAQVWRNAGGVAVASVTSLGQFSGDGSGLSGITASAVPQSGVNLSTVTAAIAPLQAAVSTAVYTVNTYNDPAWITSLGVSKISLSTVTAALAGKLDTTGGALTGPLTLAGSSLTVVGQTAYPSSLWVSTSAVSPHLAVSTTGVVTVGAAVGFGGSGMALTRTLPPGQVVGGGGLVVQDSANGFVVIGNNSTVANNVRLDGSGLIAGSNAFGISSGGFGLTVSGFDQTFKTGGTLTTALYIDSSGQVGIGPAAPAHRLDVQGGNINASGGLCIAGSCVSNWGSVTGAWSRAGNSLYPASPSDNVTIQSTLTVAGNAFSVGGSAFSVVPGKVGIGQVPTVYTLEVNGDMSASGSVYTGANLQVNGQLKAGSPNFTMQDTNNFSRVRFLTTETALYDQADAEVVALQNGRVGIGTASPAYQLTISSGAGTADQMLVVSVGGTTVFGVKGNGEVYTSGKYFGDGSALVNVSDASRVLKGGDTMTGGLNLSGSSITVAASPLQGYAIATNGIVISTGGALQTAGAGHGSVPGDPRGAAAVDLQTVRASNTQVASSLGAVLGGGANNTASAWYASVGGGLGNAATAVYAHVGGGGNNKASLNYAAVSGGVNNAASGMRSGVLGGENNTVLGYDSAVLGGGYNVVSGSNSAVGGGAYNVADGTSSVVAGGEGNRTENFWSSVGGGYKNTARDLYAAAAGGANNYSGAMASFIGGGQSNSSVNSFTAVAGGLGNSASGLLAAIGGGQYNVANASASAVGGGAYNTAGGIAAVISGGEHNDAPALGAVISGGRGNYAGGQYSSVGGGMQNSAPGNYSAIAGGYLNNTDWGQYAAIGGGGGNFAFGQYSAIPGGANNYAGGMASFAAGYQSSATANGSFAWNDNSPESLVNDVPKQVRFRASGGFWVSTGTVYANPGLFVDANNNVGIGTNSPGFKLHVTAPAGGAVAGLSNSGNSTDAAVYGWTNGAATAVKGVATGSGYAGRFEGNLYVTNGGTNPAQPAKLQVNGDLGAGDGTAAGNQPQVVWLRNDGAFASSGSIVASSGLNLGFATVSVATSTVLGVVYEPAGIGSGAVGRVAVGGVVPAQCSTTAQPGQHVVTSALQGKADSVVVPANGYSIGRWIQSCVNPGMGQVLLR